MFLGFLESSDAEKFRTNIAACGSWLEVFRVVVYFCVVCFSTRV